jgi:ketosteroid isomerase-like protein
MADLTPDQQRNVELVKDGLARWIEGDREAAIATFTEDVEVFVPAELGNAGSYRGIEQFRGWFQAWDDAWSEYEMEARSFEPVGEQHVIVEVESRATGKGSGIEVGNTLGWTMEVREGRLAYLALMPDMDAAREHAVSREGGA